MSLDRVPKAYNASKREKSLAPVDYTNRAIANKQDKNTVVIERKELLLKLKGRKGLQEGYCK